MKFNLTYKKKNLLLVAGVVILSFMAWKRSIGPMLELSGQCKAMETELEILTSSGNELNALRHEIAIIDNMISSTAYDSLTREQLLIEIIANSQSNPPAVSEFHLPHCFDNSDYRTVTDQIDLQGSFTEILTAVNHLENDFKGGVIRSLHLETVINPRTKKKKLYGSVYIQSLEAV